MNNCKYFWLAACILFLGPGCAHTTGNNGQLETYPAPVIEAGWIRNGEPIMFEGRPWYPVRDIEILQDSEVYQIGEYKGVQFFVEKTDIKPYQRLYTKFAKNKYRYFEPPKND